MAVWVIRGGKDGEREALALYLGVVAISFDLREDLTSTRSINELRDLVRKIAPDEKTASINIRARQLWTFKNTIKLGDLIVMPRKGKSTIAVGEMSGEYEYRPDDPAFPHGRAVRWINTEILRNSLADDLLHSIYVPRTIFEPAAHHVEDRIRAIAETGRMDQGGPVAPDPWPNARVAALAKELLWEPQHLQEIIDGLQDRRQAIFYGPPGTGKTYVALQIAKLSRVNGGDYEIVQFHPSYSYEDFVQGFRPRLIEGQPGFELVDGPLKRIAERARATPDAVFILVIDELNRGDVAKVFGELYFLLEYRGEEMRLRYGGDGFSLPINLWFICTMNTADRSISLMDAALRRRSCLTPFFPDEPPINGLLRRWLEKQGQDTLAAELVDAANAKLERHAGIGPSYFMGANQTLDEDSVRRIWERAVIPYVEEQCIGDEDKLKEFGFDQLKGQLSGPKLLNDGPSE